VLATAEETGRATASSVLPAWPLLAVALVTAGAFVGLVWLLARPWRVEITAKAVTKGSAISLAGGVGFVGFSASAAAILGGPGVLALHFRGRERWRRPIANVSVDAFFAWIDELLSRPKSPPGRLARLAKRAKEWVAPRTDLAELPDLGLRIVLGLRRPALEGAITCGFADPALTGKTAAVLYPLAGVLAPLGAIDVSLDWSGRTRLDGAVELSFGVVPARVTFQLLRFARYHFHPLRKIAPASPRIPASSTT
jgi:MFS family permease